MDLTNPASDNQSLEALMAAQLKLKTLERPLEYPPEVTDVDPLSRYSRQNFAIFLEKIKFAMTQIFPTVSRFLAIHEVFIVENFLHFDIHKR